MNVDLFASWGVESENVIFVLLIKPFGNNLAQLLFFLFSYFQKPEVILEFGPSPRPT